MKCEILPLTEAEEGIIKEKIMEYANAMAPSFPHAEKACLFYP